MLTDHRCWYAERSVEAARRFVGSVDAKTAEIAHWPRRFPALDEPATDPPVRRARLRRFPFALVFVELPEEVRVIAVAHQRRRPLFWASLLPRA